MVKQRSYFISAYEMENITRNYRLAFGAFVDKTVFPFIANEDP